MFFYCNREFKRASYIANQIGRNLCGFALKSDGVLFPVALCSVACVWQSMMPGEQAIRCHGHTVEAVRGFDPTMIANFSSIVTARSNETFAHKFCTVSALFCTVRHCFCTFCHSRRHSELDDIYIVAHLASSHMDAVVIYFERPVCRMLFSRAFQIKPAPYISTCGGQRFFSKTLQCQPATLKCAAE